MGAMWDQVLTLLIMVGFPQRPVGRERRTLAGFSHLAFNGGDQCGFFTADKGPGALPDLQPERKVGAKDIIAEKAPAFSLLDGYFQSSLTPRVLRPAVHIAFGGPTA